MFPPQNIQEAQGSWCTDDNEEAPDVTTSPQALGLTSPSSWHPSILT